MSLRPVVRPVIAVLAALLLVAAFGAGAVSASVAPTTGYAYDGPPVDSDGIASVDGRGTPELGVRQARADAHDSSRDYDDCPKHSSPVARVDAQGTTRTEVSSSRALGSDGGIPAAAIAIDSATTTPGLLTYTSSAASPSAFSRTEALSGRASSRQVSEMADAMRATDWDGPPIRVVEANGRRYVVDGHHRLEAARRAGIDVPYEVVDPATVIGPGQWSSLDDIIQDANSVGGNRLRP